MVTTGCVADLLFFLACISFGGLWTVKYCGNTWIGMGCGLAVWVLGKTAHIGILHLIDRFEAHKKRNAEVEEKDEHQAQ